MKHCPQCKKSYTDDDHFCLDDGTPLAVYGPGVSPVAPTQVLPPISITPERSGAVYIALGVMAMVIVALGALIVYMIRDTKGTGTDQEQASRANPAPGNRAVEINTGAPTAPNGAGPISETAARELIDSWVSAQNGRNFALYSSCYSPQFLGKKRKPGRVQEMGFEAWLRDRRASMPRLINIDIGSPVYTTEGDAVKVSFVQHWRSVNHCDVGNKIMLVKMFADGPKIVFEDLLDAVPCR